MCNPDDPEPCTSRHPDPSPDRQRSPQPGPTPTRRPDRGRADRPDERTTRPAQRATRCRSSSAPPCKTWKAGPGSASPAGAPCMPIADVIRLAAHANHYLAVFDEATGSALDLFRAKRVASPAQRIMLIGRDGGCTKPCCTVGAYGAQVHHAARDWVEGGQTNVDELGLACGPDNRMVDERWLDHQHQRSRRSRMDPTPTVGHRPSPSQLLPPTRTTPAPTATNPNPQPDDDTANRNRSTPWATMTPISPTNPPTTTQVNPHRPNRSGMAAAANRNRSTPRGTMTPISPADPRRPTTKRLEGRSSSNTGPPPIVAVGQLPPEYRKTLQQAPTHHNRTPAKQESTTTTIPNACSTERRRRRPRRRRSGGPVLMCLAEVGQLGACRAVGYGGSPTRGEDRPGPRLYRVQARG